MDGGVDKQLQSTLNDTELRRLNVTEKFGSDKGKLVPTDIGNIVTDFLINHFDHHFQLKQMLK